MKKIMELLQNMKAKNEKKDNKGFSLVEFYRYRYYGNFGRYCWYTGNSLHQ